MQRSYLMRWLDEVKLAELNKLLDSREQKYQKNVNYQYRIEVNRNGFYKTAQHKDYSKDAVEIGRSDELNSKEQKQLESDLKKFIPWRKGPFSLFGISIDSEWQGQRKWKRILPFLQNIKGKLICDVGANNGYYIYKLAHHQPDLIFGMEPGYPFKLNFDYLQKFTQEENLKMELMGFQELLYFKNSFDIILCMGVLYHHKNPLEILELCHYALKPKGQLILESMSIPGDESIALFPGSRYANMKGVWFIPTAACLHSWLIKTSYTSIKQCAHHEMRPDEQRSTLWAPYSGFSDALDAHDIQKTKEGFPRPCRTLFIANK